MVRDYFSATEMAEVLDIDLVSAEEMLEGTLEIEVDEIIELLVYKGISSDELLKR